MSNKKSSNNCGTCDNSRYGGEDGHCYMFREEPDNCQKNTLEVKKRKKLQPSLIISAAIAMALTNLKEKK